MLPLEMRKRLGEQYAHLTSTDEIREEGESIRSAVGCPGWENKPHRYLYDAIALANRACDIIDEIATLRAERDYWRTVAESRLDITPEDALRGAVDAPDSLRKEDPGAYMRVYKALRAHAAKAAQVDTKVGE